MSTLILVGELGFRPLTPTAFLDRSTTVFGDRTAVVDGPLRRTYAELASRSRRLAGYLRSIGVQRGDRVAVLAPNTSLLLEAHHGVPYAGAVLVAMNIRLTTDELAYIAGHAEARVLLYDESLATEARKVADTVDHDIVLVQAGGDGEYEAALESADEESVAVEDERSLISINYTSGTTGHPKGVAYHHRGAYLQAMAMAFHSRLGPESVFLWTLPMFHCNGWCYPWAVTAAGAVHVCLPRVEAAEIWRLIREEGVTHFNGAPTVLTMVAHDPAASPTPAPVRVATGGAPPSPTLLERMAELNMDVTHLYGLTETFGPAVICQWRPEWDERLPAEQARIKSRQGVGNVISDRLRVVDANGDDVPADGATLGEVAITGNNLMGGYYRDPDATAKAVPDGWFRTGDIGVMHPDGYIELKDRAKDIVISGGENISTIEVEQAVASCPGVLEVAVVGAPDDKWGEVPVAHVTLQPGADVTAEQVMEHARQRLAGFKVPKRIVFGDLPKTSTGKIQKYVLREAAWVGRDKRIG